MHQRPQHLTLPRGFDDVFPETTEVRRRLQNEWLDLCSSHGYQPVTLPPVGFASTFTDGHHAGENRTYEFDDRKRRRLALASDSLPAALRLATARDLPRQRISYVAPVFRYERRPRRHFHHLGLLDLTERLTEDEDRSTARQIQVLAEFVAPRVTATFTIADPGTWLTAMAVPSTDLLDALRRAAPAERPALAADIDGEGILVRLAARLVDDPSANDADSWTDLPDAVRRRIMRTHALAAAAESAGASATVDLSSLHASEFHDAPSFTIRPADEERLLGDGGDYSAFARRFLQRPVRANAAMVGLERLGDLVQRAARAAADVMVLSLDRSTLRTADDLSRAARSAGLTVWTDHLEQSMAAHLRDADRLGIQNVIALGTRDAAALTFRIRDKDGALHDVPRDQVIPWLLSARSFRSA